MYRKMRVRVHNTKGWNEDYNVFYVSVRNVMEYKLYIKHNRRYLDTMEIDTIEIDTIDNRKKVK